MFNHIILLGKNTFIPLLILYDRQIIYLFNTLIPFFGLKRII
jgi:hypothetical protein